MNRIDKLWITFLVASSICTIGAFWVGGKHYMVDGFIYFVIAIYFAWKTKRPKRRNRDG